MFAPTIAAICIMSTVSPSFILVRSVTFPDLLVDFGFFENRQQGLIRDNEPASILGLAVGRLGLQLVRLDIVPQFLGNLGSRKLLDTQHRG